MRSPVRSDCCSKTENIQVSRHPRRLQIWLLGRRMGLNGLSSAQTFSNFPKKAEMLSRCRHFGMCVEITTCSSFNTLACAVCS